MYKMSEKNDTDFQIRTETTDGTATVFFVVKLKRSPLPTTP